MRPRRTQRSAFTLVELLLALGLLSILTLALVQLLDTSLGIWRRAETGRDLAEIGGAALDLIARDLRTLEGGPRGDLVADWKRFDLDRDGNASLALPRLRLVRQADAADLLRAGAQEAVDASQADSLESGGGALEVDPHAKGVLQVVWMLVPSRSSAPDERALSELVRGERRLEDEGLDFFDPGFFATGGKPPAGSVELVTGGVLWLEFLFAAKTSVIEDGWNVGTGLADCSQSWDAWGRERPDTEETFLNQGAAGMQSAPDHAALPRRVRIVLEIERPRDLRARTRIESALDAEINELAVGDERRLPGPGGFVLIDEEWMEILSTGRGYAIVKRARRGTRATLHDAGALIHHGERLVREVPIATAREDWKL
ncbi:MAG TPA: hypothetical protein ENJ09_09175 [Planctomycetes bacterium]|nr:hypothetical protein [Planctomycetota bacterium]